MCREHTYWKTSSLQVDIQEYRESNGGLSQEECDRLLAIIINDRKEEFKKQRSEITKLTDVLLAEGKTITDQQVLQELY